MHVGWLAFLWCDLHSVPSTLRVTLSMHLNRVHLTGACESFESESPPTVDSFFLNFSARLS